MNMQYFSMEWAEKWTLYVIFYVDFKYIDGFSFIFSSLGDNYGIYGYFELCSFGTKGQGCIQYLTSDISAIYWEFLDKTYIFVFLIRWPF